LPSTINPQLSTAFLALALLSTINYQLSTVFAQGTAFTYQGRLNDSGQPANGVYDLQFTIYDAPTNGNLIAGPVTNSVAGVDNGLFTVSLDFGAGVFTGPARWLEIAARTNGGAAFATLSPRQDLTAAPYAILAGDVVPGNANVARLNVPNTATTATGVPIVDNGFVIGANVTSGGSGYTTAPSVTVNDTTGTGASITSSISNGVVVSLTVHSAGSGYSSNASLTIGPPPSNAYQSFVSTNYFSGVNYLTNGNNFFSGNGAGLTNLNAWQLNGNLGTVAGPNFVGTVDNQPLELHVNGQRALRLEPDPRGTQAANIIGGYISNVVEQPGSGGDFIGGGGYPAIPNTIHSNSSGAFIGAGSLNQVGPNVNDAVIAGGYQNTVRPGASRSVIAGGYQNAIQTNASYSFIGGGNNNTILANNCVIGGGDFNMVQAIDQGGTDGSTISGGENNTIEVDGYDSTIGGGYQNTIQTNAQWATIGGGQQNNIGASATWATIGGGIGNVVDNGAEVATIAGGGAPGFPNHISSTLGTIAGGSGNVIQGNANDATIGGGRQNQISVGAWGGCIGGGQGNLILTSGQTTNNSLRACFENGDLNFNVIVQGT
jgi:hypothetical protein